MYLERYIRGEHIEVWSEIRHLSQSTLTSEVFADIESVAAVTMQRVATNVDILVEHLSRIGWRFAISEFVREVPTDQDIANLAYVENTIGPLPIALKACLLFVGGVHLSGTLPESNQPTYLFDEQLEHTALLVDPLCLPTGYWLNHSYKEWQEEYNGKFPFPFEFAPDEYHKANYSGGSHIIQLPQTVVDPVIDGINCRSPITLVEYLRISMQWFGFPGYELELTEQIPAILTDISSEFLPF